MPDLDSQTRELLLGYLDGAGLDDMRRRFLPLAWQLNSDELVEANPVTSQASLWLAEYSNGHRGEPDLRQLLAGILRTVYIGYGGPLRLTGAATTTQTVPSLQLAVVGTGA